MLRIPSADNHVPGLFETPDRLSWQENIMRPNNINTMYFVYVEFKFYDMHKVLFYWYHVTI